MSKPIDEATHEAIAALAIAKPYHNPVAIGRWVQAFHEGYYRMFDRNASYGSEQATEFFQRGHRARDAEEVV
jgi:hypothetical protein